MSRTPEGGGMQLPNLSEQRIPLGMENTPDQRRRALLFTLRHATDRRDLADLVGMLGLESDLAALRAAS